MLKEIQVAAYEGGRLRVLETGDGGREAVLALPLSRLIVKMVRVPAEQDALAVATPVLQAMSPFPDEPLTVGCETVSDDASGRVVIAAALPEGAADDIAEALDAAKLNVTRVDSIEIGALRGLWPQIVPEGAADARRLVLMEEPDCLALVILDGDRPSAIRAITDAGDLRREVMLSLLEAEDFGGDRPLGEIVWVRGGEGSVTGDVAALGTLAPVREIAAPDPDAALRGVGERAADPAGLDVAPATWREVLEETRFKAKLIRRLAVAGGVWLVIMGVLFGVPMVYGFMTDYQKGLSRDHKRQYEAVKTMKGKVDLVRKYSNHLRGALEIMKAVSDRLPESVELSSWNFKREDGVRFSGEADTANDVYKLKDLMIELGGGDERVFPVVNLVGPSAGRGGRQKFEIDCSFKEAESE